MNVGDALEAVVLFTRSSFGLAPSVAPPTGVAPSCSVVSLTPGFWDQAIPSLIASLVGAAVGALVAYGIMIATRKTDRAASAEAADGQRTISENLATELRLGVREDRAMEEVGKYADLIPRMVDATLAEDEARIATLSMAGGIAAVRVGVLLGQDAMVFADLLVKMIEVFRRRCIKQAGPNRNPEMADILAETAEIAALPLLWFRSNGERSDVEQQLRELLEKLKSGESSDAEL